MYQNYYELLEGATEMLQIQSSDFKVSIEITNKNSISPEVSELIACLEDVETHGYSYTHA